MDTNELVDRLLSRVTGAKLSGANVLTRTQQASAGIDEFAQGLTTDPFASLSATGLRVPGLLPISEGATLPSRYLFQLASLGISSEERVCIRGIRQLLEIGLAQPQEGLSAYPTILPVTTPNWHFVDGNVSWHLMRIPIRNRPRIPPTNADSFIFRNAFPGASGALLYESATFPAGHVNAQGRPDFYVNMTSYVPPNAGQPYGTPLLPTIHEIRYPWWSPHSSDSLKLIVEGPCYVVLFASVLQSASGRHLEGVTAANLLGMPEEAFLLNFSSGGTPVQYWRVGGLIDAEWVR